MDCQPGTVKPLRSLARSRRRSLPIIAFLLLAGQSLGLAQTVVEIGPAGQPSRVPTWDARGLGPLPWQGISAVDMTEDAAQIAVGTIAPPGDPNVFVLDGAGKLLRQHKAGQRWINAVVCAADTVWAVCATPHGTAGDAPEVYALAKDGASAEPIQARSGDYPTMLFHYGDHSNHLATLLSRSGPHAVVAFGGQALWLSGASGPKPLRVPWQGDGAALATAAAVNRRGQVVLGCTGRPAVEGKRAANLVLLQADVPKPLWSRPVSTDAHIVPAPEPGAYGPPAPEFRDEKLWAPLAVAIDQEGKRVAAADYQGWERQFLPAGIRRGQGYGVRFAPSRPTIHVYDSQGKPLGRFGPETFQQPFWCDLLFSADGTRLLAFPHSWTCRGLAGQTILPADENARSLYILPVARGESLILHFPDAISHVAMGGDGKTVVGCWNGRVYLLDERFRPLPSLTEGIRVGAPSLIRVSQDGSRILVATTDGRLQMFDGKGGQLWQSDLNRMATPGDKPWTKNQKASPVGPGVWSANTGRAHSDLGGQYVVRAPQGLILIDPNAGLSIEQNWARIAGAGLDPRQVRYLLLTHEHGDHAPGAYLWRVLTGAQVVASVETACILQHHVPIGTGYGFHPPNPVDIAVKEDTVLDLAGLKVRAIRLPGHTYGSMGWAFEQEGKTCVAIGDLIMPGGLLGYSGSINFSAKDVLDSLRKLQQLKPDAILPGHGPCGDPSPYIAEGIEVGEATGWGKMTPKRPDPFHGFSQRNYLVAAWGEPIQSAAYGDIDGDGRPDVAVLVPAPRGSAVKIYLNQGGRFRHTPDSTVDLPEIEHGFKLRMGHLNADRIADFLATGESGAVLLVSRDGRLAYRAEALPGMLRASQLLTGDLDRDGRTDCLIGQRFVAGYQVAYQTEDGRFRRVRSYKTGQIYFDVQLVDLNGDGRADLVTSAGEVYLQQPEGTMPETPTIQLARPGSGWTFMAAADFNGDRKVDVVLLSRDEQSTAVAVFYNTGSAARPLAEAPNASFSLPLAKSLLRDGPTVGDWNADGLPDLVLCGEQGAKAMVLLGGSPGGLNPEHKVVVELDYAVHHDTRVGLLDFNGDGKTDLASFGLTKAGAAGVYVWLQPPTGTSTRRGGE